MTSSEPLAAPCSVDAGAGHPPTPPRIIRTDYDPPPIPYRGRDWCAWIDGQEEYGPFGWGRTEAEAVARLEEEMDAA